MLFSSNELCLFCIDSFILLKMLLSCAVSYYFEKRGWGVGIICLKPLYVFEIRQTKASFSSLKCTVSREEFTRAS